MAQNSTVKVRDVLWDNVKAMLIFTVVIGHMISRYRSESEAMNTLYLCIYSFHMPAFIFVTGLMSKKTIDNHRYEKLFSYFAMYIMAKVMIWIPRTLFDGSMKYKMLSEEGAPWYALAVLIFYILTMYLRRFNTKYVLAASVFLGLISGYCVDLDGEYALARVVSFYPFFYLAYILDITKLKAFVSKIYVRIALAIILIATFAYIYVKNQELKWALVIFKGKQPYIDLEEHQRLGFVYRLFWYILAIVLVIAVISLTPCIKSYFTSIGQRSLQIYVIHYGILEFLYKGFDLDAKVRQWWPQHYTVLIVLVAVTMVFVLSAKPIEWVIKKVIYPDAREIKEETKRE